MLVKNVSARLHHVGNVMIAPNETKEIPDSFAKAINKKELIAVASPAVEEVVEEAEKGKGKAK